MEIFLLLVVFSIGAVWLFSALAKGLQGKNSKFVDMYLQNKTNCMMYSSGKDWCEAQRYYVDRNKKILYLFFADNLGLKFSNVKRRYIKDITKCEFTFDNTLVHSTNRGSQIIGATAGGLAFGGVGAIVGGLSGTTTSKKGKATEAKIVLYFNEVDSPIETLTFQKNDYEPQIDIEKASSEFYATILACMSFSTTRKCPFCAEEIKKEAIICKHCGREVDPEIQEEEPELLPIVQGDNICPHCKATASEGKSICPSCFFHLPG